MFNRLITPIVLISFLVNTLGPMAAYADAGKALQLPEPGTMVSVSPAFEPVLMKGLKIDPKNPFRFDFILDQGDIVDGKGQESLKEEANRLIKYFLASLTIPERDLWVNLSPYEKDRMIASNLAQTEMGRDMLAQDYILKQLTASLIYPEKELGKTFWDKVYAKAQALYGNTNIPVNTFNKVWIVADKADVFERENVAYVVGAHLKVMLEEDYLANSKKVTGTFLDKGNEKKVPVTFFNRIVRDIVLPELENEVNQGKNFAPLRQMFYSMILASWYKMALKDALIAQIYGNQSKVKVGINQQDPKVNDEIFDQYLKAYKKGVFNYIKEDINKANQQPIPRKYFSGGEHIWGELTHTHIVHSIPAGTNFPQKTVIATVDVAPKDKAMVAVNPLSNWDERHSKMDEFLRKRGLLPKGRVETMDELNQLMPVGTFIKDPQGQALYNWYSHHPDQYAVVDDIPRTAQMLLDLGYVDQEGALWKEFVQRRKAAQEAEKQGKEIRRQEKIEALRVFLNGRGVLGASGKIQNTQALAQFLDVDSIKDVDDTILSAITFFKSEISKGKISIPDGEKNILPLVLVLRYAGMVDDQTWQDFIEHYQQIINQFFKIKNERVKAIDKDQAMTAADWQSFNVANYVYIEALKSGMPDQVLGYVKTLRDEANQMIDPNKPESFDRVIDRLMAVLNEAVKTLQARFIAEEEARRPDGIYAVDTPGSLEEAMQEARLSMFDRDPYIGHLLEAILEIIQQSPKRHSKDNMVKLLTAWQETLPLEPFLEGDFTESYEEELKLMAQQIPLPDVYKIRSELKMWDSLPMVSIEQVLSYRITHIADESSAKTDPAMVSDEMAGIPSGFAKDIVAPRNQAIFYNTNFRGNTQDARGVILSQPSVNQEFLKHYVDTLMKQIEPGQKLLSVGEGQGHVAQELMKRGVIVSSIDISKENTKKALERGVNQKVGDATRLAQAYEGEQFDIVLFSESIGGMNIDEVLQQAYLVLRPGGQLLVATYRQDQEDVASSMYTQFLYYSEGEILQSMKKMDLQNINTQSIYSSPVDLESSDVRPPEIVYDLFIATKPAKAFIRAKPLSLKEANDIEQQVVKAFGLEKPNKGLANEQAKVYAHEDIVRYFIKPTPLYQPRNISFVRMGPLFLIDQNLYKDLDANLKEQYAGNFIVIPRMQSQHWSDVEDRLKYFASATIIAMQQLDFKDRRFLDIGAGDGILSVIAHKLGASELVLVERDDKEIAYAKELLKANGVDLSRQVHFIQGDIQEPAPIVASWPSSNKEAIASISIGTWPLNYGKTTNLTGLKLLSMLSSDEIQKINHIVLGGYQWGQYTMQGIRDLEYQEKQFIKESLGLSLRAGASSLGDMFSVVFDRDAAMASAPGGIDFNASKMQMNVSKEIRGIHMQFDPALIEKIKREGFDGLEFTIRSIEPVANLPAYLGINLN